MAAICWRPQAALDGPGFGGQCPPYTGDPITGWKPVPLSPLPLAALIIFQGGTLLGLGGER
jgi:hypothetical protein